MSLTLPDLFTLTIIQCVDLDTKNVFINVHPMGKYKVNVDAAYWCSIWFKKIIIFNFISLVFRVDAQCYDILLI